MAVVESPLRVETADSTTFDLTVYRQGENRQAPVFLCLPAMGVEASYYAPLAKTLCAGGVHAVTADSRGLGTSSVRAGRKVDFGYREVVEVDLPAILNAVRGEFPDAKIFLLGHSLGGQMACLFAATKASELAGVVLVAACSLYYRSWKFPVSLGLLAFQAFAKILAWLLGYFPGRTVGFGGREARRLIRDWCHQGRTGRYEAVGSTVDFEALLATLKLPLLAISFTDDATYCPAAAVVHLLGKMPATDSLHLHLSPLELGASKIGHFSWVKQANLLTPRILDWLRGLEAGK